MNHILEGSRVDFFMYTAVLYLRCLGLRWRWLGYSDLLYWVAEQQRLKTTALRAKLSLKLLAVSRKMEAAQLVDERSCELRHAN